MIIKSMSRKEASFGQLMDYINRDKNGGSSDERYRIRHNLLSRDQGRIRSEFEQNAEHLRERKNGVFMYHEIISITRAKGIDLAAQKERLHQIAQEYVAARAPRNLCYGGLHDDKEHSLHYHLMISANRTGEAKRHRLSKEQFKAIQIELERHVLNTYPELEQKVAIEKSADTRMSRPEAELKRRTGRSPQREPVRDRVLKALAGSNDRESLLTALSALGLDLYVRGQNIGIIDREDGKRHRVRTLDTRLPVLLEAHMSQVLEKPKNAPEPTYEAGTKWQRAEQEERTPQGNSDQKKETPKVEPLQTENKLRDKKAQKNERGPAGVKYEPADEKEKEAGVRKPRGEANREEKLSPTQERWKQEAKQRKQQDNERKLKRDDDLER